MGLTAKSTGLGAVDTGLAIQKKSDTDQVIALAGNPNVGKSTVFNELTGMNQHTGNWPGKTVSNAQGEHCFHGKNYIIVDLPGTYSLLAHSAEEEVARDFICFGKSDAVVVVCDATCLERNMNLVLQTIEITKNVVVCVNLMDEAKKKQIQIDLKRLEENLGVPVVGAAARSRKGLTELMERVEALTSKKEQTNPIAIKYISPLEKAIGLVEPLLKERVQGKLSSRWAALKLLDYDSVLGKSMADYLGENLYESPDIKEKLGEALSLLQDAGIPKELIKDKITSCLVLTAEGVCSDAVFTNGKRSDARDRKIDKILTSKKTGIPIMLGLLAIIFWLTICGANYPSQLLSTGLFWVQDRISEFFVWMGSPEWLRGLLVDGVCRTLFWVVSVMLPPMAIFFPLFTLLEDFGYLPRVAFNLDHQFKKANACGKQALTMCMLKKCMPENQSSLYSSESDLTGGRQLLFLHK